MTTLRRALLGTTLALATAVMASACEPSAAMLSPTYPPKDGGACWQYMGSVVTVDFVDRSDLLGPSGLPELPLEFPLDDPNVMMELKSRSQVTDFTLDCDLIVVHVWLRIQCDDPEGWEGDQLAKLRKRFPKVTWKPNPIPMPSNTYLQAGPFHPPAGGRPGGGRPVGRKGPKAERDAILAAVRQQMEASLRGR